MIIIKSNEKRVRLSHRFPSPVQPLGASASPSLLVPVACVSSRPLLLSDTSPVPSSVWHWLLPGRPPYAEELDIRPLGLGLESVVLSIRPMTRTVTDR